MEYANVTLSGKLMLRIRAAQETSNIITKAVKQLDVQEKSAILQFLEETFLNDIVRDNETGIEGRLELERTGDKTRPYRLVFAKLLGDGRNANKKERIKVWSPDTTTFNNLKAVSQAYTAIINSANRAT